MTSSRDARGGNGQPSISDEGQAAGEDLLARRLSELARNLQAEDTLQDTLDGIVRAAVTDVPGAQYAGISVVEARREGQHPRLDR